MADPALQLSDDQMCFGCGKKNTRGLQLDFELDREHRKIKTRWTPVKEFQGYAEVVHGGMIGLVLDELMVNLLWTLEAPSVTATLYLKLRRPAYVGQPLECEAWIKEESGRYFQMEAVARNPEGQVAASAEAACVKIP